MRTSLSEPEAVSQLNILSFYYKVWQLLSEGAPQGESLALFICITIYRTALKELFCDVTE